MLPSITTNQHYIEAVTQPSGLDITDRRAVFQHVLDSLPVTVTVYPTENYYYFAFYHGGIRYAGNIRLDVEDRDAGKVHFTYFKEFTPWQRDETTQSAVWSTADGVNVTRLEPLAYRISVGAKAVTFNLIDLSDHKPPHGAVRDEETYIGPVFDESALRFFLVFNSRLAVFHYVLDETTEPADVLTPLPSNPDILVATRTGFAFYKDRYADRLILIGVHVLNTELNNYFDGPFDQLPDNFLTDDRLKNAILTASPEMKGKVDRFGNSPDNQTRYLIAPYMLYEQTADLELIGACARREKQPSYYACFSYEQPE